MSGSLRFFFLVTNYMGIWVVLVTWGLKIVHSAIIVFKHLKYIDYINFTTIYSYIA